jgi:hypothetical protein
MGNFVAIVGSLLEKISFSNFTFWCTEILKFLPRFMLGTPDVLLNELELKICVACPPVNFLCTV